jgi:hypothetical protein
MITKVDLDDKLAADLETAAKARGLSMREFIRMALRQATDSPLPAGGPARFTQRVHDFGTHIESPWTSLADIETEEYFLKYNRK